jgi:hypothetical protein
MSMSKAGTRRKQVRRAAEDMSRSQVIAKKLKRAAGDEDPAHVAGAIVIFATETIQRSANDLLEARGYLDGIRGAIDGLLKNAFADDERKPKPRAARPVKPGAR